MRRQFARTHAIGQIVPGKVTKLVPFGAFVRVDDGIEGLVHISELAERHVEIPEQVVQVGSDVMVKVIDIDLERRRISLSLKQANEELHDGHRVRPDPVRHGRRVHDAEGNYIYPDGFDPETQDWQDGYDKQREEWERQPTPTAHTRYEQHMKQIVKAAEVGRRSRGELSLDQRGDHGQLLVDRRDGQPRPRAGGTLASDEQLAALRERLLRRV